MENTGNIICTLSFVFGHENQAFSSYSDSCGIRSVIKPICVLVFVLKHSADHRGNCESQNSQQLADKLLSNWY